MNLRFAGKIHSRFDGRDGLGMEHACSVKQPHRLIHVTQDRDHPLLTALLVSDDHAVGKDRVFPRRDITLGYETIVMLKRHVDQYLQGASYIPKSTTIQGPNMTIWRASTARAHRSVTDICARVESYDCVCDDSPWM